MALTATSMPTPPSHLLYTNTNDNYRRPSQLKTSNLTSDLDLAVFVADLMTSYAGTPPLSSASSSSESSMDSPPNTITVKNISREILFGTGIPSSPLAGLSTAGVRHKRTLSFSATLLHRPSVASNISYDGEGREEEFHASFPLPPRAEISDDLYSNGNIRRASVPASDTASLMAQLDETSRYLDEVLPCTPSPTGRYPPSPTDPSPRERFSCRYGYPETYYSLALPSSNPSPDDAHPKLTNRDTVLSLPFVWADGSPLKRQPTNASIHPLRTNLKRQKSQYAPFPESPKLFSPTWAEGGFGFPFWELNSGSPVNPTRSTRRPSLKNLTISTKIEPPLPTKINTILETDPKTNEQPSPVPSSACLPDSLWPSPVLEPIQLPIETLTPLDLDDVFLVAHTKPLQAEKEIDIDQAMKDRETVLRVSERLNQEQLLSPARPSPPRTPVARPQVLAPVSACQKHPAPLMTTLPLRINKDLPQRPQTPANVSLVQEMVHPVPVKTVKHGKRSTDDLWRTMVPPLNSPLQVKADKVKQASQRGSPESSPIPIPANPRRTPSPVKHSNSPPRVGCLSPTQVSPAPSIRSASPAKTPVPPRPMRSPSPLILNGLDFLDDYHSPLRSAAPSPSPAPMSMRASPLSKPRRRDSLDSLFSDMDEYADRASPLLRITHQQFAQQIPSKAARNLGVSEDVVMVLNRSPSRNSNFSEHNIPPSAPKPKKHHFGGLFGSGKKGRKTKTDISLPLSEPIDPVVLYSPSVKSPVPMQSLHQGREDMHAFPWLSPTSSNRPISPAGSALSRSPNRSADLRKRETSTQQWI